MVCFIYHSKFNIFTITIENEVDHGGIESIAFALPDNYEDFIYYKLDEVTGKYYDFSFDPVTGEGAIIQNEGDQKFIELDFREQFKRFDVISELGMDPELML